MTPAACSAFPFTDVALQTCLSDLAEECRHLSGRSLPDHALRDSPGLQGIVQAKPTNMRVSADTLDPCEIFYLGIDPDFRHDAADEPVLHLAGTTL